MLQHSAFRLTTSVLTKEILIYTEIDLIEHEAEGKPANGTIVLQLDARAENLQLRSGRQQSRAA